MPDFHYALYHSISLLPPTADFHNDIMKTSQKNNMRDGLTGFLHREGDFFLFSIWRARRANCTKP